MADLAETEFRTVIEDARAKHAAIVNLMLVSDAQAIGLLRLYVPLAIATASGMFAATGAPFHSYSLAMALMAMSTTLLVGSGFCLYALRPVVVNLPGREPAFWIWAMRADVSAEDALTAYLDQLDTKQEQNRAVNMTTVFALRWAKICGLLAPVMGVACAAGFFVGYR
jgi:hypothetical protein